MSERLALAQEHWPDPMPDWVRAIVEACDASSQSQVARRLDYSSAVVSQVLRRRYPGDLARLESRVRAELLRETVNCPALGEIGLSECQQHRANAAHFTKRNPLSARMRRACNGCPLFKEHSQ